MSSTLFLVTPKVRHLAAWTQESAEPGEWATGVHRPICGGRVRPTRSGLVWPGLPYEDETVVARAMRKPLCTLCAKTLAELTALAGESR